MVPEGQDITEHITEKYGISAEQANANRENIRQRGAQVGFKFSGPDEAGGGRSRIYNTFDAHRLLHWAETVSSEKQKALKQALFKDGWVQLTSDLKKGERVRLIDDKDQ
eukprot:gene6313-7853_t